MKLAAVWRVTAVVLAYGVAAVVLVVPGAGLLARVLALPDLFTDIVRWGVIGGLPIAAVLAWAYPRLGHGGLAPTADDGTAPLDGRRERDGD